LSGAFLVIPPSSGPDRLLLLLANFGKEGNPPPINPNTSQETRV